MINMSQKEWQCQKCGKYHHHKDRGEPSSFCLSCHPDSVRVCDYIPHPSPDRWIWDNNKDEWIGVYLISNN